MGLYDSREPLFGLGFTGTPQGTPPVGHPKDRSACFRAESASASAEEKRGVVEAGSTRCRLSNMELVLSIWAGGPGGFLDIEIFQGSRRDWQRGLGWLVSFCRFLLALVGFC